jgi:predicted DNA-binding protein with PD1-like motif
MRAHAFRLGPGADLRAELERMTGELSLGAGCVLTCVGSLASARLRMPGAAGEPESFRVFEGPLEIVSLTGTLGPDGPHLHISLAGRDGACVGGHLVRGCSVHTTAELVIGELLEVTFHRAPDAATGYGELTVTPRR